jgi:hypothetical protein
MLIYFNGTRDDIVRSVKKLKVLGKGFDVITIASRKMIQSIPQEMNMDHTTVLTHAGTDGYILANDLRNKLQWTEERMTTVLVSLSSPFSREWEDPRGTYLYLVTYRCLMVVL